MSKRDYYAALDLHPACTHQDIKSNFKRLALKWHPDKCPNKTEAQLRFSEINEAYTILSDMRTKQIYDVHGHRGIEIDQENGNQGVPMQRNFFFEKGFQGSQKSAFEVLQDIFQEKDDDNIFSKKDNFGVSDTLRATLKSFMEDGDLTNSADVGMSFFDTYKPTFMNPEFMMPPPDFESGLADQSYTASIFSYFATSSDDQMYATTSSTVFQNGSTTTSTQEMFINGDGIFRTQETKEGKGNKSGQYVDNINNNKLYEQFYTQCSEDPSIMVINDDSDEVTSQNSSNKDIKLINKRTSDEIMDELNAQLRDSVSLKSKKISKDKNSLNIRLMNKKPSKKNRS